MQPPEWLPPGWKMEVRERKSGSKLNDKYYIHTKTGYKFRSKREVFGFLETAEVAIPKKRVRGRVAHDRAVVVRNNNREEGLPPGWILETKFSGPGSNFRKDKYYIDPSSGYKFRSRLSVYRYLESGEVPKEIAKKRAANNMRLLSTIAKVHEYGVRNHGTVMKELNFPCRTSRRLAGLEPELAPDMGRKNRSRQVVTEEPSPDMGRKNQALQVEAEKPAADMGRKNYALQVESEKPVPDTGRENVVLQVEAEEPASDAGDKNYALRVESGAELGFKPFASKKFGKLLQEAGRSVRIEEPSKLLRKPHEDQGNPEDHFVAARRSKLASKKPKSQTNIPIGKTLADPCLKFDWVAVQSKGGLGLSVLNGKSNFSLK
ncbi:hypothetical protein IFM89_030219 [Coptis chinensis]|uniref:MBD domain-containing protein n=1 Tax=Coptis chinensis TaxID=261450 RepID=A0A835HQY5_9MAGN|nr:hypothetical protein IFM89_030219 [Coptis chinensis]